VDYIYALIGDEGGTDVMRFKVDLGDDPKPGDPVETCATIGVQTIERLTGAEGVRVALARENLPSRNPLRVAKQDGWERVPDDENTTTRCSGCCGRPCRRWMTGIARSCSARAPRTQPGSSASPTRS
jgi:hypothetical protein